MRALATRLLKPSSTIVHSTSRITSTCRHYTPLLLQLSRADQQQQQQQQQQLQKRSYSCQIQHPTKLGQLRSKIRTYGEGYVELDINHSEGLGILTFHNPEKHNALTGKMFAELADCVDLLEEAVSRSSLLSSPESFTSVTKMAREQQQSSGSSSNFSIPQLHPESKLVLKSGGKVLDKLDQEHLQILDNLVGIVVTGSSNKSYCAGLDISAARTTLLTSQSGAEMSTLMVSTLSRFLRLPIVTIAAIERAAIGGGAELTTFCDHRCLAENAKVQFVQTEMGVVPGWGGGSRLLGIVSRSHALRLLAAAEPIKGGQEGVQIGYAELSAPPQKTVDYATNFMQKYVWEKAPSKEGADEVQGKRRCVPAVRSMKSIVSIGVDHDRVERVSELEKDLFKRLWGGPDNLARVNAAFSGKKK
ncbi:enoyl CoA hydratase domain-containing protein 1 [Entomortierella beljakovae]|nr:enoyl CoA hydratase domain-containing protein 1 [Entomortierella beljakovae]